VLFCVQCEAQKPTVQLEPQGLPVDDVSPAADVMPSVYNPVSLSGGSEPGALDIGSATRGNRLVSTDQV